jgi:DNA-binding SARP family transcriptional activator
VDLAAATYRRGDPAGARPLLRQSLALAERLGFKEAAAWAQEQLGLVAAAHGERAEAVTLLRQSLAVHHELGDRWRTASVLEALAGLHVHAPTSARLLAAAVRLREAVGTPLPPSESSDHNRRTHAVHTALGPTELGRATTEGRALSVAQAVELALADPRPAPAHGIGPAALSVTALGGARVELAGRVLGPDDWTYAKPRELFFHLLTRPGATKAEIGLALWPEASRAELRNSFHTCLKYLRRALGPAVRIRYAGGAYHLEPVHGLRYDVEEFRNAAAAARRHDATPAAVEALTEAAAHYRGDFLGDTPAGAWAEPHREELRRSYEHVLRRLGALLARERRYLAAVDVFTRLVAHDPLLEAAHRGLMRCHAALGDPGRALRQYHELADLLDAQLGAVPAPETTQLYTGIRDRK